MWLVHVLSRSPAVWLSWIFGLGHPVLTYLLEAKGVAEKVNEQEPKPKGGYQRGNQYGVIVIASKVNF